MLFEQRPPDADPSKSDSRFCIEVVGMPMRDRRMDWNGRIYEAIPTEWILEAASRV